MPKKEKDVIVVIVSPEDMQEEDYVTPRAKWYFIDACGNYVYLSHADKNKAVEYVDLNYGKNKYKLHELKEKKVKGELSVRGFVNNKSRSGSYSMQIKNNQGRF